MLVTEYWLFLQHKTEINFVILSLYFSIQNSAVF